MRLSVLVLLLLALSCGKPGPKSPNTLNAPKGEKYRPQFHFTPPAQWMNDPNGMFHLNGTYHLFYQYYPDSTVWGPMHWGHATSRDLVRWEHQPVALYPDSLGYIFSGSAVVDWKNTSQLGDSVPPVVALFTYHDPIGEKAGKSDFQRQGMAFSRDGGHTWTKYADNPVLANPGIRDFRDPKVIWHAPTEKWIMTLAVADHVRFYSSPDLKEWTAAGDFGRNIGAHGGVWECPDLFPIRVEETGEEKWVLLVSINPGGPQGGSATQYFVGDFDGYTFRPDEGFANALRGDAAVEGAIWLDHGADNYAGVTWSDAPDGRRIFIGWLSNWQYAQVVPTASWRSAMTLARDLSLHRQAGNYRLHSRPVPELEAWLGPARPAGTTLSDSTYLLQACVRGDFTLTLSNDLSESLVIRREGSRLTVDRRNSGQVDFHPTFGAVHALDMTGVDVHSISLYMDTSSAELFVNQGERVMTELLFPSVPYNRLDAEGALINLEIQEIRDPVKK